MLSRLLYSLTFGLLLLTLCFPALAQVPGGATAAAWFELHHQELRLYTGGQSQAVTKPIVLPNGTRLDHRTRTATLADGRTVQLREGDRVSLAGVLRPAESAVAVAEPAAAPAVAASASAGPPAPAPAPPAVSPAAFTYRPPAPVNGKLKGVVELGASGFNSFIVRVDPQKRWQLERAEFGNSLVLENIATPDDVRRGLKAYIAQMLDYGVGGRDIHFVVSSGAALAEVTKRIITALHELGYVVHTVSAEQEGV